MSLVTRLRHCKRIHIIQEYVRVWSTQLQQERLQHTRAVPKLKPYQPTDVVPVFRKASNFVERIALRDSLDSYTYGNIFLEAKELSKEITKYTNGKYGERILFLCPNDASYVITQWAIWMSGQIAVPLSNLHPQNILLYYCNDCRPKLLMTTPDYSDLMYRISKNANVPLHVLNNKIRQICTQRKPEKKSDLEFGLPPEFYNRGKAMILYTSGTTGNPKGVVLTHRNLVSQITTLLDAWRWSDNDVILHTLPLHHVHGIVNAMLCPHYIGAKCVMLPKFDSNTVWSYLLGVGCPSERKVSVFMAVPTIYSKLIEEYQKVFSSDPKMVDYIYNTLRNKIRLMVSGSAPLPVPVYNKWLEITGHRLLERYGMTEIGMCLSHLYDSDREPGYVGVPLPGVTIRLAYKQNEYDRDYTVNLEMSNNNGNLEIKNLKKAAEDNVVSGELFVKGENVFKEYYNLLEATHKEFTKDGFFKTGDMCEYSFTKEMFRLLGRSSVDIIKTGGYKVSALEVETRLLAHPDIKDCAVVGVADPVWGERVAAVVVLDRNKYMILDNLRTWAKEKMPEYTVPTVLKIVESIPKNAMGKVNKKELVKALFQTETTETETKTLDKESEA